LYRQGWLITGPGELNETFNLDFEIFGSEGDVTDRKSNAFAKHNRLIASIDTLKRPARVKRLLEAPPWDLVVFDEAHHLSAYKMGGGLKNRELQTVRSYSGPLPGLAIAFGHSAPGRPFPFLDAGAFIGSDPIPK